MLLFSLLLTILQTPETNLWIDKAHTDFQSGKEFYYTQGDNIQNWNANNLRTWQIGAYWWSPQKGGLKILRRDMDLDDNGYKDVILTYGWYYGDTLDNVYIYWNYKDSFSSQPTRLSTNGYGDPQGIHIADLNNDGYEDLMVGIGVYSHTSYIYYGTENPYVFYLDSIYTDELIYGAQALYPIDLNGDGYLDLWIPGEDKVFILYGPNLKYRNPDKIINFQNAGYIHHPIFADINNDNYLDVVMGADGVSVITIAFGPNFTTKQQLESYEAWVVELADINKDGYLDILSSADYENYIYWGSAQGYSNDNRKVLYGPYEGGGSIADFNNDGILDLAIGEINIFSAGNSYVRYGPDYDKDYIELPGGSAVAADWDNDGDKDLLMFWGDPGAKLFWNRNGSFSANDYTYFYSRPDDAIVEDFGNLWDRSNKERFLSRIHEICNNNFPTIAKPCGFQVGVYGNLPKGINLSIDVRSSSDGINWSQWFSPTGSIPSGAIAGGWVSTWAKYIQYRLIAELDYHHTTLFVIDSVKGFLTDGHSAQLDNETKPERIIENKINIVGNIACITIQHQARFEVLDVTGRKLKSLLLQPGKYEIPIANANGVYFVKLSSNIQNDTRKAIVK